VPDEFQRSLVAVLSDEPRYNVDLAADGRFVVVVDRFVHADRTQQVVLGRAGCINDVHAVAMPTWTATCPTPPGRVPISTRCLGCTSAMSTKHCHAVRPAGSKLAASTWDRFAGLRTK
jgi:hypothetical protein